MFTVIIQVDFPTVLADFKVMFDDVELGYLELEIIMEQNIDVLSVKMDPYSGSDIYIPDTDWDRILLQIRLIVSWPIALTTLYLADYVAFVTSYYLFYEKQKKLQSIHEQKIKIHEIMFNSRCAIFKLSQL